MCTHLFHVGMLVWGLRHLFYGRRTCYFHQSIWHRCGFETLMIWLWFNCIVFSSALLYIVLYILHIILHSFCMLCMFLTILYLLSLLSFQARYCMYGSFEAGATRRTAQVLYSPSETYRELHNSLTSFLHCSVVGFMLDCLNCHIYCMYMLRYSFLCMIISYVQLCALSCILPLP